MKTHITNSVTALNRWLRFPAALLAVALMAPAIALAQSPAPVNLRSTANFVVLAASLISNIPTSAITGDVGLSPAAGSGITGFGANEVTGTIYTVDATGPAGSVAAATRLTAAKGDLTVAYNDAVGRTPVPTGPFLNPGSGNIGGLTLVPGLYKFTSDAAVTGSDVTLAGSATSVWIFQITSALNVGAGFKVILSGGAQAANIFWQVGTSATLGTNSVFKGTIMADQSISLNTGATLEGRALVRIAAVTLASSVVTAPAMIPGTLTGVVKSATDTSVRIANALVILRRGSATGAIVDSARTNASGIYVFSGVASGMPNYWISVSAPGFIGVVTVGTKGITVANSATTATNFSLPTSGTITGSARRGTPANYLPIANALMVLQQGTSATSPILDSTRTNATGQYTFTNVTPGSNYRITLSATGYAATTVTGITVGTGGITTANVTAVVTSVVRPNLSAAQGIRFSRQDGRLTLNLGASQFARSIRIFSLNGALQRRVYVPAGETQAIVPVAFSPENGFLFEIK